MNDAVTPDDLFRATNKGTGSPNRGNIEHDKLVQRMAKDLGSLREEISNLRSKLRGLEEGQMTVDNIKLTRQLDQEKEDLNKERGNLLKIYALKNDKLEEERKKLMNDIKIRENEMRREKEEVEQSFKKLEVEKLKLNESSEKNENRKREIDSLDNSIQDRLNTLQKDLDKLERDKSDLAQYAIELEELKNNLMKERENLGKGKEKMFYDKNVLEQEIKDMKAEKNELERNKERELKDLNRKKQDFDFKQEKFSKEQEDFIKKKAEFDDVMKNLENQRKGNSRLQEELEEHNLNLWKDRNKLNQEVKGFIDDKKAMENDLKWQKNELKDAIAELDKERDEIDEERQELIKYSDELESLKMDLETRERKLLMDQEDFYNMKKKFLEKIMESGSYENMTPEMKKMAQSMGIDVDEMIEENKRLKERREMMDKLKKENDESLAKLKEMGSRNTSKSHSRRASILRLAEKNNVSDVEVKMNRKVAVSEFLNNLYEMSSTKHMLKDLADKREELRRVKDDLDMSRKIIDNLRNDNKSLKKELDIVLKITEGLRGDSKLDLDAILGRKRADEETQTEGKVLIEGETEHMEERIQELERELRKRNLDDKLTGNPRAPKRSDFEDEDDHKSRASEIDEMMQA